MTVDCCRVQKLSCKAVQQIILQPSTTFELTWRQCSDKHICVGLDRRIYFENHQVCYYNDGIGGKPRKLYELHSASSKTSGVLLYHTRMLRFPCSPEEREVCLLMLSHDGYLRVLNANTGEELRSVFISTAITFRYLSWANYLHTVLVKSTQNPKPPSRSVARGNHSSEGSLRLMVVALFKVHPLELIMCMAVERNIFGDTIRDASVNEDILVVSHSNGMYNMYSLHWILEHCSIITKPTIGQLVEVGGSMGQVGAPGFGVPITVKLTECPPLLFACKSGGDCGVSFGGSPSVFLHNPTPKLSSVFCIKSLKTQKKVAELSTGTLACHHDVAEFHFEDYQRVLHISGCTLRCYYLSYENGQPHKLVQQYATDFKALTKRHDQPLRTSSGRIVKRRICSESQLTDHISAIQDVDYENEVELLYVVVTVPGGDEGTRALLCFIDDKTGVITKKIPIPTWHPDADNSIYYELDCIIHLLQGQGHSTCNFYQLNRT